LFSNKKLLTLNWHFGSVSRKSKNLLKINWIARDKFLKTLDVKIYPQTIFDWHDEKDMYLIKIFSEVYKNWLLYEPCAQEIGWLTNKHKTKWHLKKYQLIMSSNIFVQKVQFMDWNTCLTSNYQGSLEQPGSLCVFCRSFTQHILFRKILRVSFIDVKLIKL